MDLQARDIKADILDLSIPISNHSTANQSYRNFNPVMSNEELKIRGELEMDVEKDMEQEIKDEIYHLALRLHRLYQHQKERNSRGKFVPRSNNHQEKRNQILSEVNINIKLEEGTKIEIKETKKEVPAEKCNRPRTSKSDNFQGLVVYGNNKKFDWARSLRSGPSTIAIINRANARSHQGKTLKDHNLDNARKNLTSAAGQRRGNAEIDNKILELGWKC